MMILIIAKCIQLNSYINKHIHIHVYIYIYIYRERERYTQGYTDDM